METLPNEIVLKIAEHLNPADRWKLSTCSQRYRNLLPVWLRLRILSRGSQASLQYHFYVTRPEAPEQPLLQDEQLYFGEEYFFWTFDYKRENFVFLGRHGQKLLHTSDPPYIFTLGLRPQHPDQTWIITNGQRKGQPDDDRDDEDSISIMGKAVPFGSSIGLTVGGRHPKPHRPDSSNRLFLSVHTMYVGCLWYVVQNKQWAADENLEIVKSSEYQKSIENIVSSDPKADRGVFEQALIVHAVPDIMDGGYSLFSPERLQHGDAACDLYHATVSFHFWMEDGMMYFHAFESLHFWFGVPILEEDEADYQGETVGPMNILLAKNSSRWWAIKHYMSTAADVSEGRDFELQNFLRSVKDHEDHSIVHDKDKNLVYIQVQDAVVDKNYPPLPRTGSIWKFLLCG